MKYILIALIALFCSCTTQTFSNGESEVLEGNKLKSSIIEVINNKDPKQTEKAKVNYFPLGLKETVIGIDQDHYYVCTQKRLILGGILGGTDKGKFYDFEGQLVDDMRLSNIDILLTGAILSNKDYSTPQRVQKSTGSLWGLLLLLRKPRPVGVVILNRALP